MSPWKAYGDVRGLNAPPRRSAAPAAFTDCATERICSRDSTEHGPAQMTNFGPPIATAPTRTTVSSGWNLRFARLYGSWTLTTRSTSSSDEISCSGTRDVSPTRPTTVCSLP